MLFSVIGAALIAVAICVLLSKTNPEYSMLTALITGVLIFSLILINFTPILDEINNWADEFKFSSVYLNIVIKSLGICYITQLASDTCKDAGYGSIGVKVELAGKITIILIALPLFKNLLDLVKQLIKLGG